MNQNHKFLILARKFDLLACPGWGAADVRRGPFSLKAVFLAVLGLRSGLDGSGQAVGFIWSLFRTKPLILDPFRTKFDVFGPDWNLGQPGFGLGLALGKSRKLLIQTQGGDRPAASLAVPTLVDLRN